VPQRGPNPDVWVVVPGCTGNRIGPEIRKCESGVPVELPLSVGRVRHGSRGITGVPVMQAVRPMVMAAAPLSSSVFPTPPMLIAAPGSGCQGRESEWAPAPALGQGRRVGSVWAAARTRWDRLPVQRLLRAP